MIRNILFLIVVMMTFVIDGNAQTEMADGLRSSGKIYVVVVVLATIFAGIFAYLVLLDRRISKIEKEKR